MEIAGDGSHGTILIGLPRRFRQNACAVMANIDRGGDLVRGVLKATELDEYLFGDAAFGPDRGKCACPSLLSPPNHHDGSGKAFVLTTSERTNTGRLASALSRNVACGGELVGAADDQADANYESTIS